MNKKAPEKFILKRLTAVSQFNYEIELPIYDGIVIAYQSVNGNITDLITLYWDMYDTNCTFKIKSDIKLSDYVKDYEDFKALDATIEKAKYHIDLAHKAAINAEYIK